MGWFFPPAQPPSQPPPAHLPPGVVVVDVIPPTPLPIAGTLALLRAAWPQESWPAQTMPDGGAEVGTPALNAPFPLPFWNYTTQASIRSTWPTEQWTSQQLTGGGVGATTGVVVVLPTPPTPLVQLTAIRATWAAEQWPAQQAPIVAGQLIGQAATFVSVPPPSNFWATRAAWPQESWYAQSEPAVASGIAQIQLPPPYNPSSVVPQLSVLRSSWPQESWTAQQAVLGAGAQLPPVTALPAPIPHNEFRLWPVEAWSAQSGTRDASAFGITAPATPYIFLGQQASIRMSWPPEAWGAQRAATIEPVLPQRISAVASTRILRSPVWQWPQEQWLAQAGTRTGGARAPVFVLVPPPPQRYDILKLVVSWPQEQWSTRLAGTSAGAIAQPATGPIPPPIFVLPVTNFGGRVALSPKKLGEDIFQQMDFISRLGVGETIVAAHVTCSIYSGTDPNASNMVQGPASVSNTIVVQSIAGGVTGAIYELLFTVTTSAGQILQLSGFFVVTPDLP